jgi:hypothetical protein
MVLGSIDFDDYRYEWLNWETSSSIEECTKPAKLTDETSLSTYSSVAKLPDSVIDNIFTLQRNLVECLDSTTAMEFRLCQEIGETAETLPELEELQNIRERLVNSYSRLQNILLRIAQSQPIAARERLTPTNRTPVLAVICNKGDFLAID